MATKAIEVYMRLVGESYLKHTLQEPIHFLVNTTRNMEVDCSKLQVENLLLEERQNNLLEAVEYVWKNILRSSKGFPP